MSIYFCNDGPNPLLIIGGRVINLAKITVNLNSEGYVAAVIWALESRECGDLESGKGYSVFNLPTITIIVFSPDFEHYEALTEYAIERSRLRP